MKRASASKDLHSEALEDPLSADHRQRILSKNKQTLQWLNNVLEETSRKRVVVDDSKVPTLQQRVTFMSELKSSLRTHYDFLAVSLYMCLRLMTQSSPGITMDTVRRMAASHCKQQLSQELAKQQRYFDTVKPLANFRFTHHDALQALELQERQGNTDISQQCGIAANSLGQLNRVTNLTCKTLTNHKHLEARRTDLDQQNAKEISFKERTDQDFRQMNQEERARQAQFDVVDIQLLIDYWTCRDIRLFLIQCFAPRTALSPPNFRYYVIDVRLKDQQLILDWRLKQPMPLSHDNLLRSLKMHDPSLSEDIAESDHYTIVKQVYGIHKTPPTKTYVSAAQPTKSEQYERLERLRSMDVRDMSMEEECELELLEGERFLRERGTSSSHS